MSVREYAILYLGRKGAASGGAGGGNVMLGSGQHALDGPEHLAASDQANLDASLLAHGLLPKLSGVAAEKFGGDGIFAIPILEDLTTAETDTSLAVKPDGAGGLMFGAVAGTGGGGDMVPTYLGPTETFTVPVDRQITFAMTIDNEGILDIEGFLVLVS